MAPLQPCARTERMEYLALRMCVFDIERASADHTSRIIFRATDRQRLYEILNDYHDEAAGHRPGAADEFRQLIDDARQQWAVQLRDTNRRDIEVIIEHEYFGTSIDRFITARHKAIKKDLEDVGGKAYHSYPYNKESNKYILCIVVPSAGLEAVLTQERMDKHAITYKDITAPAAADYQPRQPDPGCQFWYRNADSTLTILPTPPDTVRHRSNTIERLRQAPPGAWDPYRRPQTVEQQEWKGRKPFSAEIYAPESNANWIERDLAARSQQLEEHDPSLKPCDDDDDGDSVTMLADPYPSLSNVHGFNSDRHGEKPSIGDIQRDFRKIEDEIAETHANFKAAKDRLQALMQGGTLTTEQIWNSQEAHDVLYAELEMNKLPTLHKMRRQIANSLTEAQGWEPKPKMKIMKSANGSTIWEEPVGPNDRICLSEDPPQDIIVGKPPSEDEGKKEWWWTKLGRMIASVARGRRAPPPTPAAVTPPTLERRDSAVSFSAGVAADVATGGIGRPAEWDQSPTVRYV